MPLYEYECDACGHRFEVIQKFSDPLADTCPVCGGPVHKCMSSPAIQFKGTGWYITDYAKKDGSSTSGAGKSAKSEGKSDGKSETPSETKAESKGDKSASGSSSGDSTAPASSPAKKD